MKANVVIESPKGTFAEACFRSLPGLAYVIDESYHFVLWNDAYQQLLGYDNDAMRRINAIDVVAPSDQNKIRQAITDAFLGKEVYVECSILTKTGAVPISGAYSLTVIGEKRYLSGNAIDLSESRNTAAKLVEILENYQDVFNATNDAIFVHGEGGRLLEVNDRMCEMYRCRREDVIGIEPGRLSLGTPPYSAVEASAYIKKAIEEGPQLFEWLSRRFDGEPFWSEVALRSSNFTGKTHVIAAVRDITQRKETEEALRASEAKFRQFFDGAGDALFIHDRYGRIIDVNRAACENLQYSRDELTKMSILDIEVEVTPNDLAQIWTKVMAGEHLVIEGEHHRKDGAKFPVDVHVIPLTYGDETFAFAAARDISARKAAEHTLRENARRLALAISATKDAVWEWNLETGATYVSPRWYEMLGYAPTQLPQTVETWTNLCHPDDLANAIQQQHEALHRRDKAGFAFECRVRRADDTWAWILCRGSVTERNPQGAPLVLSGTHSDVSKRHKIEQENAEWKQRYELLARATEQVVYDCDVNGSIVWGGAFNAILGYGLDDLQGGFDQWAARIHPEDRVPVIEAYQSAAKQKTYFSSQYRFCCKNGEFRLCQDTGYPQCDAQGTLLRYVGVIVDITDRTHAETETRKLEESLRQAQKMESVGRLAGGIAHDFNNLLTAISGNLSLAALNEHLDEDTLDLLQEALKAADSAAKLTRQLLAFSRKQVIRPKVICLNDVVSGVQTLLHRLLGENIELSVKLDNSLGFVRTDAGQLEQVLVNLAVNARDAMPDGGRLDIETANVTLDADFCQRYNELSPGPYVLLSVGDDGIGMTPDVKSHLFEPFFTTKELGKGTGLGLAMVYGAVKQNHGHIEVLSEPKKGTRFRIYLPRTDQALSSLINNPIPRSKPKGETIVIVEDDPQVRALAVRVLEHQGYVVHAFEDGEKALRALSEMTQRIGLLLTDVIMPQMNGKELVSQLKRLRPNLRVLYTSGYTEDVIGHHGVLDAGIEFLAKPYSVTDLAYRVREILDGSPQDS
jgi:PAS domain S-box-containing protein